MNFDVVIVGGGPAGLACAISLKERFNKTGDTINVCILEKGSAVGSHILSGNVFEPRALDELIPDWRSDDTKPIMSEVKKDEFYLLTKTSAIPFPTPPPLHNSGNYIISLSDMCKWLATKAEALGVEIFAGFSASELIYDEKNAVCGVATKDVGIDKQGKQKETFTRGIELRARHVVLAEGARGSLSESLIERYSLRSNSDPPTYGLGLKEIWQLEENNPMHSVGLVKHTVGWPAASDVWFGSFMYHMQGGKILLGAVVGLDYKNPYTSPYNEFQQLKLHPHISQYLKGAKCIQYGARVINEGGLQSLPKCSVPGATLIGCSAGFLNVPKIKGSHTAMKSGMIAAESIHRAIINSKDSNEASIELADYDALIRSSWIYKELHEVRNYHPSYQKFGGLYGWGAYALFESYINRGRLPYTFHHHNTDDKATLPASKCKKIEYPKPDNVLTFDILTNLSRAQVEHEADQPSHLQIRPGMEKVPTDVSLKVFDGPEQRFCPAKVYEYSGDKLVINAANCVHCKTCDIKTPGRFIKWTVPEGGGGPNYEGM